MTSIRAHSSDGREWRVTTRRFQLPELRAPRTRPWDDLHDLYSLLPALFLTAVLWSVRLLFWALVQLPHAIIRALFSQTRWIEVASPSPTRVQILWRTSADRADEVARELAAQLQQGSYRELGTDRAVAVRMKLPPELAWLRDVL